MPGGSRTTLRIDRTIDRKARSTGSKSPARSRKTKRGFALQQWAWVDLNYRPHAYQACALTT